MFVLFKNVMKDLITGLILGFVFGVTAYLLIDGHLNANARDSQYQASAKGQAQVDLLTKLCPEVLAKVQTK